MGSINIIKPLSTFLPHASLINRSNIKIPNKNIEMAQNQICGNKVKSTNASRVLCRPPHFWYSNSQKKKMATPRSDGKFVAPRLLVNVYPGCYELWTLKLLMKAKANLSTLVDCSQVEFGIVNADFSGSLSPCHRHWLALLLVQSLSRQI